MSRRGLLAATGAALFATSVPWAAAQAQQTPVNLAKVATPSTSYNSGDTRVIALNDGQEPANSADTEKGMYGNWPKTGTEWVEFQWSQPVTTDKIEIYWWVDGQGVGLPKSCRLLYWNGKDYVPVKNAKGLGLKKDQFNSTTFDPVTTDRLRLEITSDGTLSTGVLEWRAWSHGAVPAFAPAVAAGIDRIVMTGGRTWLSGKAEWLTSTSSEGLIWRKVSGPGEVSFADATSANTTAKVTAPGDYILELAATANGKTSTSTLRVRAETPPPAQRLDVVYTKRYSIDSPLWNARAKSLIVNWMPHVISYCERTDLKAGDGGLDNFIEAAKKLRGEPHGRHRGYVFSNAWVIESIEAMCICLMVDPRGDAEIIAAQDHIHASLERWIPIILGAQEPDGYLQTAKTLAEPGAWDERWSADHRGDHEGYIAGYFIESAINHYTLTNGQDLRLYNAAKKLADCWVANIGPGKKAWFDGHQEMEQALVRFGRFVNDMEGPGHGDAYIALGRFLLESRRGGQEYDQSHLPPTQQYEAVGHAVRAVYFYSAMADIAAETHDTDYQSAVMSLWDNMVNRKYYITGGIGSGETSEGFGPDYSLRNGAYCESCSSCGLIFFQYKLNLAYHDAKYADLYEQTIYNALLGSTDLDGQSFCYTNPLTNTERTKWHVCPCCVANIPRTLLMLPTWTYVKGNDGLYVNLFVGSRITVEKVAGTDVEMVQETDYPWNGKVKITVNPKASKAFALRIRIPDRKTSELYTLSPQVGGVKGFMVNGKAVTPEIVKGYAVVERTWQAGDTVSFELPMAPQRIIADQRIEADRGRVALAYGPLVYNVERADQPDIEKKLSGKAIEAKWRPDLLDGVMTLTGTWEDGSPMLAIPNYARMNRVGAAAEVGAGDVDYAPGSNAAVVDAQIGPRTRFKGLQSQVWIRSV
ncbi:Tat pathway signal protein [Asticcacaulis sp. AC460]|nr:Tat pathway signal protein [Asticcacaulis sp. AC460]